jgi:hypothetical protein
MKGAGADALFSTRRLAIFVGESQALAIQTLKKEKLE